MAKTSFLCELKYIVCLKDSESFTLVKRRSTPWVILLLGYCTAVSSLIYSQRRVLESTFFYNCITENGRLTLSKVLKISLMAVDTQIVCHKDLSMVTWRTGFYKVMDLFLSFLLCVSLQTLWQAVEGWWYQFSRRLKHLAWLYWGKDRKEMHDLANPRWRIKVDTDVWKIISRGRVSLKKRQWKRVFEVRSIFLFTLQHCKFK